MIDEKKYERIETGHSPPVFASRWKSTSLKEAMETFRGKKKPLTQDEIVARGDSWLGKK